MTLCRYVVKAALVTLPIFLPGNPVFAQSIQGTASYPERITLPRAAVFEAALEEVSRADAPAKTIARTRLESPGNPPIAFTIRYDPASKRPDRKYAVRARILLGDKLLFTTDTATPVITGGGPTSIALMLRKVSASPIAPPGASKPSISSGLAGTSWQLVKFQSGDGAVLTPDDSAKYTIAFGAGGELTTRVDCNRGHGTWKSSGSSQLQFGPLALTRAACPAGSLHDQIVKQWGHIRSYVVREGHLFLSLMADGGIYEFEPLPKTGG